MCLWRNVKIDQRAKVYSFFKLVFMMKYSCKVEKKPKNQKKLQPSKLQFYSLSCRKLSTGAYACLWIKWHWKWAVFQLRVFVFSQRSVQKYFLYLGYLKTCINMIMQCDQAYFSLKSTLLLLAFKCWNYTQINCTFLSYHQALLWMHLGNSQASSKEDIKQRKNRTCIL